MLSWESAFPVASWGSMPSKDVRLVRLAERQHTVFTRAQAMAVGFTPDEIDGRLERGLWERVHRGVYRLAGSRLTFEGRVLAAILAAGDDAFASDGAAARLWKIEGVLCEEIHISLLGRKRRRVPGVIAHQRRNLSRTDRTRVNGIPLTTPGRTLMDLAPSLPETVLEDALDDVLRRKLAAARPLLARVREARKRGRPGLSVLERLLEERVGRRVSGSTKENDVRRFFRIAGLPPAVPQHIVRSACGEFVAQVDFAYPEVKLAIEFDGYEKHASRKQWEADRIRQNRMVALGWYPIRVTDRQLKDIPKDVVDTIWSR